MDEKLNEFLTKRTNISVEQITDATQFSEFGIDSVEMMCLIADLESEFNIQVSDRELENLYTVADLKSLLAKKNII